jgi:xyloglucan-specific endo-beta-1,4-glucanase
MKCAALLLIAFLFVSCRSVPSVAGDAPLKPGAKWNAGERFAQWATGGYTLRNDVWGDGHGPQRIWADSPEHWGVWADHPETSGVKAYPHVAKAISRRLSEIRHLTSRFDFSTPETGNHCAAYDIWCDHNSIEIMVWVHWNGAVAPIARGWDSAGKPIPEFAKVTIGGEIWTVYSGTNGANKVFSFLRTAGNTTSGEVDLKALLSWIRTAGWFGDVKVEEVQFGWEITASPGGAEFTMRDFSVDAQ